MAQRNENARRSDQTHRANQMSGDISPKYITPLMIIGAALFAFPIVDDLTNMPATSFFGIAAFAVGVSIVTASILESGRCGRW